VQIETSAAGVLDAPPIFFHGECGAHATTGGNRGDPWNRIPCDFARLGLALPLRRLRDRSLRRQKAMAIATATAPADFDAYDRLAKPQPPVEGPAMEALKNCAPLRSAPVEALRALARQATLRPVSRGLALAAQGAGLDAAILVVRGRIRSVCRAPNGREISVEIFKAGDLIADGAISAAPLGQDWEAVENGAVLMIPREALLACLRANPEIALALAAELVARVERSKQLATGLALAGVQERVVARLVALGRQDGAPGPEGLLIRSRPTQQELANQIGACRETVSRTVSELDRQGLLTPRGRSLLLSPRLLEGPA
jgi:CRP-like cAMP-binding protein